MNTLADGLREAARLGVAPLDAQLLLLQALGRPHDRAWLRAHDGDALPEAAKQAFLEALRRRLDGEPVAYLLGEKEFFGLALAVDARVLVPRPDTETLVDWALSLPGGQAAWRVADLGTGSGAIALALKQAQPHWQVLAVDASADALQVARGNADRLGLALAFHHGSWLEGLDGPFDLMVSNPPYIALGDAHLPALRHEPRSALVSGTDGLDDLRAIAAQAPARLAEGGWLLLEHGHDQAQAVQELLLYQGFRDVQSRPDLSGTLRCTGGRQP